MADEDARKSAVAALAEQLNAVEKLAREKEARVMELRASLLNRPQTGALARLGITLPLNLTNNSTSPPSAEPAVTNQTPLEVVARSTDILPPAYTSAPPSILNAPASSSPAISGIISQQVVTRGSASLDPLQRIRELRAVEEDNKKRKMELHKRATAIDCCFVMDCTGSMGPWLEAAKKKITGILGALREKYTEATIRVAFVGYRDFEHKEPLIVHDFVAPEELTTLISPIEPTSGRDAAEDVLGGIEKVLGLTWKVGTRLVIHIGDSPPHGCALNNWTDTKHDRYTSEKDPAGRDGTTVGPGSATDQILRQIVSLGIDYHFFRLKSRTEKMEKVFNDIITLATSKGQGGGKVRFTSHKMAEGPESFLPQVLESITTSVARSLAVSPAGAK
ncbi:hypothetical protein HDU93_007501 [Gonapodya sp. JEL0774]|nr:hypothetical protein HDU93_007501 [Gonapodya sp. JEL0774]